MKRIFASLISLFFFASLSFSQPSWQSMITPSFKNSFEDICFPWPDAGWIVGWYGNVLKTIDGGATWIEYNPNPEKNLWSVHAFSADSCWIVGSKGYCCFTINGGNDWTEIALPASEELNQICFVDPTHGWIAGNNGVILYTTDGATWQQANDLSGVTDNIYSIAFLNESQGYAGSRSTILRTLDGGKTWTPADQMDTRGIGYSRMDIRSIFIFNENEAFASGYGSPVGLQPSLLMKTSDGGKTWRYSNDGDRTYGICDDIDFIDRNRGIGIGKEIGVGNIIITTENGGVTWTKRDIFSGLSLKKVAIAGDRIWVIGGANCLAFSDDWAASWRLACDMPAFGSLYAIATAGNEHIWVAGFDGAFIRSTDRGKTWQPGWIFSDNTCTTVYDLFFKNETDGWAVGMNRGIRRTRNRGETWETISYIPALSTWNMGICFADEQTGFIVGSNGTGVDIIYKSTDGGSTWEVNQQDVYREMLLKIDFANPRIGCVVAEDSLIIYTDDGGASWHRAKHDLTRKLDVNDVQFIDEQSAWAVGEDGVLLFSNNSGKNWVSKKSGTTLDLESLVFITPDSGFVVGEDGYIGMTRDGGDTWARLDSLVSGDLRDIDRSESGRLWIAGMSTTVLVNEVATHVFLNDPEFLPDRTTISQNYPNPFNQTTRLQLDVAAPGRIELKIMNLNGQLVASLIDDFFQPGRYAVSWEAGGIASGTYILCLKTGRYFENRKIILMK